MEHLVRVLVPLLLWLALGGCHKPSQPGPPPNLDPQTRVYHDFGILPLGVVQEHTLKVPVPQGGDQVIPGDFHGDCLCARGLLMIRTADGKRTRAIWGLPDHERSLNPGETLELRLRFDTREKEVTDLARTLSHGRVSFTEINDGIPRRLTVPVMFHYGLKSPVKISPVAHINFGNLPRLQTFKQRLQLESNLPGVDIQFLNASSSKEAVQVALLQEEGKTFLDVTIAADKALRLGPFMAEIGLQTDYPELTDLRIPVSGKIIGDFEYLPSGTMHFNLFDFQKPKQQYLTLVDHRPNRPAQYVVQSLVDTKGADLSKHFQVEFKPLKHGKTRVTLKYLGNMEGKSLRGELRLADAKDQAPIAWIHFNGHNNKP